MKKREKIQQEMKHTKKIKLDQLTYVLKSRESKYIRSKLAKASVNKIDFVMLRKLR